MIIRSAPPAYVNTHPHPAWERFAHRLRGSETVLLVHAPAGTGRFWFAGSWGSASDVRVVHLKEDPAWRPPSGTTTAGTLAQALAPLFDTSPATAHTPRIAVVLDSLDVDWKVLAQVDWQLARTPDLLLTPQEIKTFRCAVHAWTRSTGEAPGADRHSSTVSAPNTLSADEIHRITGGWLDFALTREQPTAQGTVERTVLAPSLEHWIDHVDGGWDMAKAAYLEPITDRTLAAFFDEVHGSPPSLHAFRDAGLLISDDAGSPVMPPLVRATLRDLVRRNDAALAIELESKAIEAVAQAEGVLTAARRASLRQQWGVLTDLLTERWAELFTSDARSLRRTLTLIPRSVMKHLLGDFGTAAAHILAGAKSDGMSFLLPDGAVPHESDTTAHRMRRRLTAMYRGDPGCPSASSKWATCASWAMMSTRRRPPATSCASSRAWRPLGASGRNSQASRISTRQSPWSSPATCMAPTRLRSRASAASTAPSTASSWPTAPRNWRSSRPCGATLNPLAGGSPSTPAGSARSAGAGPPWAGPPCWRAPSSP